MEVVRDAATTVRPFRRSLLILEGKLECGVSGIELFRGEAANLDGRRQIGRFDIRVWVSVA